MDMYFTPRGGAWDSEHIRGSTFEIIPGIWGHSAGAGLNVEDIHFIDRALGRFLT
jgi:homoserine O-acetyltransferase